MIGALKISSMATSLLKCAFGFSDPLWWLLTETLAKVFFPSSGSKLYLSKYLVAIIAKEPGAVMFGYTKRFFVPMTVPNSGRPP